MQNDKIKFLNEKAVSLRKKIMEVGYKTQSGHLSSALSCTDIVTALYYGGFIGNISKENLNTKGHFILSKGHACIIQYLILNDLGIVEDKEINNCCHAGSILGAHPDCLKVPGIESTTGALGHGFSIALGMALAEQYKGSNEHVYVILGDGECEEGSIWEAALCAGHLKLSNLTVIIDYNKLQASDYVANITSLEPFREKWDAFGFYTVEINGHDMHEIVSALYEPSREKPKAIIAHTKKGRGVEMIEGLNGWHGRKPTTSEWNEIKKQMEG